MRSATTEPSSVRLLAVRSAGRAAPRAGPRRRARAARCCPCSRPSGERVAVDTPCVNPGQLEDPVPALSAHERGRSVQPDRRDEPRDRTPVSGDVRRVLLRLAHQTTAASATSDTSAWMIAKRRFMGERGGAADRSSCSYPQTGVSKRSYPPTLPLRGRPEAHHSRLPDPDGGLPPPSVRAGRRRGASGRDPDATARGARAARGATERQAADPRGADQPRAARRHVVLPPGRRLRGRAGALVRPGRSHRLERRSEFPTTGTRRTRPRTNPTVGWYRKEFTLPRSPKKASALLEGALRGRQLPDEGLAERAGARVLHRLLPLRGAAVEPAQGTQHAGGRGVVAAQQHATSRTGGPPPSTASERAAGGTSAASCARSTCGGWTRSTWST